MNKVNKGMVAIIIILVGIICLLAGYVMFDKIMATKKSSSDNKVSDNVKDSSSNGDKMSYDDLAKIKSIIGIDIMYKDHIYLISRNNGLGFLLDKTSINDISNNEKLYLAGKALGDDVWGKTFTKEDFKKAYNTTALANLEYTDGDVYDGLGQFRSFVYDKDKETYTYSPYGPMEHYMTEEVGIAYVYDVDNYVKDNKYVVVNKYLFANMYKFNYEGNEYDPTIDITSSDYYNNGGTAFYGSYNDCKAGLADYDKTANNSVGRQEGYWLDGDVGASEFALKNYDSIKDKLDTYTYTFEKKDGHFVLTDFNVEHSK